jgi:hypothetical protein
VFGAAAAAPGAAAVAGAACTTSLAVLQLFFSLRSLTLPPASAQLTTTWVPGAMLSARAADFPATSPATVWRPSRTPPFFVSHTLVTVLGLLPWPAFFVVTSSFEPATDTLATTRSGFGFAASALAVIATNANRESKRRKGMP